MLNKFEQVDNMSAGKGNRPTVAAKPVLQRFQQAAKENDSTTTTTTNTTSSSPSNPVFKSGHPPAVKLAGLTGGIPALKPTTTNSTSSNAGDKWRRLGVPKAFQNGQDVSNDNNNNNSDQTVMKKDSWPNPKSPVTSSDNKPPVVPKFPTMSISNQTLTNNTPKQTFPSVRSDNNEQLEKPILKNALLPKNAHTKTDSIRSNSSNSSSTSTFSSSSSSSSNQTTNVSSPISPTPKSPLSSSSQSPSRTDGVFDFKSMLRKVEGSLPGPPVKRVLSSISNDSSSSETATSKAPVSAASSVASNIEKPKTPSRVPLIPSTDSVDVRIKPNQNTEDIVVIRKSDGKRFRRMPPPDHKPVTTPQKPVVPSNIDLTSIRQQYQKLKGGSDVNDVSQTPEDGDVYWDGETVNNAPIPPSTRMKPVAQTNRASQRISLIPEMSAEEEFDLPVYDDTPIEEDIYDDAMSERPNDGKPKTSVSSEPLTPTETDQDKKKRLKEEANARKKEEKERREKEKKEKDEEKRRKRKEEEETRLRNKFNLTGQEKTVGEGVIKQDAKASGLNLKVKKGQIVTIIRLDSNPPNKWLVKVDTQMGYVESQNIEVDPNIIRQAMTGGTEEDEFDQPTYDDVPEESAPSFIVPLLEEQEEDEEEIYEMCE